MHPNMKGRPPHSLQFPLNIFVYRMYKMAIASGPHNPANPSFHVRTYVYMYLNLLSEVLEQFYNSQDITKPHKILLLPQPFQILFSSLSSLCISV